MGEDVWSNWLLHVRHADDADYAQAIRGRLQYYADRVLEGARLAPGMTLADVGAGEGLIAFRAIERLGPELRAIFVDVSAPMLRHAERLAGQRGIARQCSFQRCSAENLLGLGSETVDAVATRAALAYVADKRAALREFLRVLKPGGRLSLAEPIFRDEALAVDALRQQVENRSSADQDPLLPLLYRWRATQFPDTLEKTAASPITNFSERDLVAFAHEAGFGEIHMELHIDLVPFFSARWETMLGTSPHPLAPPLGKVLAETFTPEERQILEPALQRSLTAPGSVSIERIAYLTATKPLPSDTPTGGR